MPTSHIALSERPPLAVRPKSGVEEQGLSPDRVVHSARADRRADRRAVGELIRRQGDFEPNTLEDRARHGGITAAEKEAMLSEARVALDTAQGLLRTVVRGSMPKRQRKPIERSLSDVIATFKDYIKYIELRFSPHPADMRWEETKPAFSQACQKLESLLAEYGVKTPARGEGAETRHELQSNEDVVQHFEQMLPLFQKEKERAAKLVRQHIEAGRENLTEERLAAVKASCRDISLRFMKASAERPLKKYEHIEYRDQLNEAVQVAGIAEDAELSKLVNFTKTKISTEIGKQRVNDLVRAGAIAKDRHARSFSPRDCFQAMVVRLQAMNDVFEFQSLEAHRLLRNTTLQHEAFSILSDDYAELGECIFARDTSTQTFQSGLKSLKFDISELYGKPPEVQTTQPESAARRSQDVENDSSEDEFDQKKVRTAIERSLQSDQPSWVQTEGHVGKIFHEALQSFLYLGEPNKKFFQDSGKVLTENDHRVYSREDGRLVAIIEVTNAKKKSFTQIFRFATDEKVNKDRVPTYIIGENLDKERAEKLVKQIRDRDPKAGKVFFIRTEEEARSCAESLELDEFARMMRKYSAASV